MKGTMKRKRHKACAQQLKGSSEEAKSLQPQFLQGVKCHIHPACFGSLRRKIFQNHLNQYGGELVSTLPEESDSTFHVVFEESVDKERLKHLVDTSRLPNSIFLKCSWLVECVKSKTKVNTENYLILPIRSAEICALKEGISDINKTRTRDTDRMLLEEPNVDQVTYIGKTPTKETQRTTEIKPKLQSPQSVRNSKSELDIDVLNNASTSAMLTSHNKTIDAAESSSYKDDKVMKHPKEFEKTVDEAQGKKLLLPSNESSNLDNEDKTASKMKSFPQNLQEKFVCARPSSSNPENLNAHITSELEKLSKTYKSTNDTWRTVAYQRAIAAIRNYGKEITSREEALAIPGIGGRLADKVAEILESGRLRKVAEVCEGEEVQTLNLFLGVWGAGPTTAQMWYYQGHRTLQDLRTKAALNRHQLIGLKHYDDINSRIPRSEVAEIENHVREATLRIVKGAEIMVCGSYRRGKATCGDVDVLITHPDGCSHKIIFKPLLSYLRETGFLTDDLVTQEDNGNQQKYLGVCKLPGRSRKHRRLDVIVVPFSERATALMYFTGSAHFNRSMRLLATKKGMSLSEHSLQAGVVRKDGEKLNEGHALKTPTEESIFVHLGLEYRPPEERDH